MKPALVSLSILVFPLVVIGCTDATAPVTEVPKFSCTSNSATMPLPAELRAGLPVYGFGGPDDAFVAISKSTPGGFAGMFLEGDKFVLTFTNPDVAEGARPEIQKAIAGTLFADFATRVPTAEFRSARWSFVQLDEWFRYISPVFGEPGISAFSIDEGANTISIDVVDEAARARVEAKLAALGASCNLVTTSIMGYATAT